MERYVEKEEKDAETTSELTDWVGVVLTNITRGVILYIGDARYHIICTDIKENSNKCCGGIDEDGISVKDTIDKWEKRNGMLKIKNIYCFDSYRELMQWFTDGITD